MAFININLTAFVPNPLDFIPVTLSPIHPDNGKPPPTPLGHLSLNIGAGLGVTTAVIFVLAVAYYFIRYNLMRNAYY